MANKIRKLFDGDDEDLKMLLWVVAALALGGAFAAQ